MKHWQHVFKLDPAKEITDDAIEAICLSGTDAIIVGGTDDVTAENVYDLLMRIQRYELPIILEISTMDAIVYGFDYYFIPMVMNSKDKKWMMDIQHEAIKQFRPFIDWQEMVAEGYCILNERAKAYERAACKMPDEDAVIAYADMAEHIFNFPIFYIEYSGTYGSPELVERVKYSLDRTLLFYGGGIASETEAKEMKEHADVIVVGNVIYTNLPSALQTVSAI